MIETREQYLERHLRDFKQFEFEERMLREKYERALKKIVEAKENYYGNEYPDAVDEIAIKALEK